MARLWITVLAAVFALCITSGQLLGDDAYTERLMFADGLYSRQMYDLALKEYAALLKAFPEGPSNDAATFRLAECLRLRGDKVAAARFFSHVVVNFRDSPFQLRAAYRRARLYAEAGEAESAVAHFRVILQQSPPPDLASAAQYYLGESLLEMGLEEEADKTFAEIGLRYANSGFRSLALMKRAEIRRERWVTLKAQQDESAASLALESLAFFGQVLENPGSARITAEALYQSASIYFSLQQFEKSAELYRRLLTNHPEDERFSQALLQAAWSAANVGLFAEALSASVQGLADPQRNEIHDEWLYLKANSERQLLQHEAAMRTYRELLEKFPESRFIEPARYEMAVSYYKAGSYDLAVAMSEQIRLTPALRSDVCWLLAESYSAMNMPAEAVQYYLIVVRESPGTERARDALYRLAHQLQKQQSYREASRFYLELVAAYADDPLAPQALFASAFCLSRAGAQEEAVRDWRRLVQEFASHELAEDALYQKAMGEIRLGRRSDAESSLEMLLSLYPKSRFLADAFYWKGMLCFEQEKFAEAEMPLREALRLAAREELRLESMFQLGLILQKIGKADESVKLLQDLVSSPLKGRVPPALLEWLASWHGERKDFRKMQEAALLLTKSNEAAWGQAGWVLLGRSQNSSGQTEDAVKSFQSALATGALTQYAAEAALQLGDLALKREAASEASRYFREASESAVGAGSVAVRARAFMGLGKAAELDGKNEDASRFFLSVAILYDDDQLVPECLFRAAQALDRLGRHADRDKTVLELFERYPESDWTEKARKAWPT